MDPLIAKAFADLSDRLTKFFTGGMFTVNKPYTKLWSNTLTLNNANDLQQRGTVNVRTGLSGPGRFVRLTSSVNGTLYVVKDSEPSMDIQIYEPIIANVAVRMYDEEIIKFRVEPNAYPMTLVYTCSR